MHLSSVTTASSSGVGVKSSRSTSSNSSVGSTSIPRARLANLFVTEDLLVVGPCLHLSVEWTVPLRGPLALGAGVGYALGLLVPVGEEFLCSSRGDVEGS